MICLETSKISLMYFVANALADNAKLVKDAKTAKKVAFSSAGAFFAIHASNGIIEIWPSGDSSAVLRIAMKRASIRPPVSAAVH